MININKSDFDLSGIMDNNNVSNGKSVNQIANPTQQPNSLVIGDYIKKVYEDELIAIRNDRGIPNEPIRESKEEISQIDPDPPKKRRRVEEEKTEIEETWFGSVERKKKPGETRFVKQSLILKILRFQGSERFGKYLMENGVNFAEMELQARTMNDLKDIEAKIKALVMNKSTSKMYENGVEQIAGIVEANVSNFYNIKGFKTLLMNSEDFMNELEEIKLSYEIPYVGPEWRMIYTIGETMLLANAMTKFAMNMRGKEEEKITNTVTSLPKPDEQEQKKTEEEIKEI